MQIAIVKSDNLSDIAPLRPPTRSNGFTVLSTAHLSTGKEQKKVLLQQAKHSSGCGLRKDMNTWIETLESQLDSNQLPPQFVRILGILDSYCQEPQFVPGSIAGAYSKIDRPIFVVDFYERGSLRDSLDRGEFHQSTLQTSENNQTRSGQNNSHWENKISVLKDIVGALHYIQCHFPGHQLGSLSSDSVFLDTNHRAYLSWHSSRSHLRDYITGRTHSWRYLPPTTLLQLKNTLSQEPKAEKISVEQDDMYAFGILAWEVVTEEQPFEVIDTPVVVRPEDMAHRFSRAPPQRILELIRQCIQADKAKRPSWCAVLSALDALNTATLDEDAASILDNSHVAQESLMNQTDIVIIDNNASTTASSPAPATIVTLPKDPCHPTALSEDKTKVVEMMESVLDSTFYRRELPDHLDSFTGPRGKKLFQEMIAAGTGECYFRLSTVFNTQSDPAFCGVSSLSMVLNALEIDPRRQWRGVWRWYSDEQLDCCTSVDIMKQKGITFNQFSCLARCHAKVTARRADRTTIEQFRKDLLKVCTSDDVYMVLSFSRATLGQTGSGHFSPIGGFHAGEDKALVLDTARFKYPPFFATVQEIWDSMLPIDPETGECRGYFLVSPTSKQKLDIQRKRLQKLIGNSSLLDNGYTTSTASSSSVSLPSQTTGSTADLFSRPSTPLPELDTNKELVQTLIEDEPTSADDEHRDCDCDCRT
ncbi:hypothetical protein FBU30_010477 [Linnemannia zychae]|nr:hypothetical protein FBU30_010477 [Linnemannia zychae]